MRSTLILILALSLAPPVVEAGPLSGAREIFLIDGQGDRLRIGQIRFEGDGYELALDGADFADHFLSMRPFRCITAGERQLCHLEYPYANARDLSAELTDLEYDLLFVSKGAGEYGIDMWNGAYYRLAPDGDGLTGTLHEVDLRPLAVPPPAGEMRPIRERDLHAAEPADHWLPVLRIE